MGVVLKFHFGYYAEYDARGNETYVYNGLDDVTEEYTIIYEYGFAKQLIKSRHHYLQECRWWCFGKRKDLDLFKRMLRFYI